MIIWVVCADSVAFLARKYKLASVWKGRMGVVVPEISGQRLASCHGATSLNFK
jgi:hypothetical protein